MARMTEQDLIELGFERNTFDNYLGDKRDWYYYVYYFTDGFSLITQSSDEVVNNNWHVEVFETDEKIRFTNRGLVEALIIIINNGKCGQ